jgi:uncharacterized protein YciI
MGPIFYCVLLLVAAAPPAADDFVTYPVGIMIRTEKPFSDGEYQAIQSRHIEFLRQQRENGNIIFSGPFEMSNADSRRGLIIFSSRLSREEVEALVKNDQAIRTGRHRIEILMWMLPRKHGTLPE